MAAALVVVSAEDAQLVPTWMADGPCPLFSPAPLMQIAGPPLKDAIGALE